MWSTIREHPVIAAVSVGCTVAGALIGLYLAPAEWSTVRGLAAGALAGAGVAYIIVAARALGAFGEDA